MMKFNRSLDWLKESDEDDNLLADDELDAVEEEMNEGLYVDPSNYDKHNDLVDVVDKAGNPQKMTQATYDKNKDSGEFEKKEPEEKEEPKAKQQKSNTSDKETTKQIKDIPIDADKYPNLSKKVSTVNPKIKAIIDDIEKIENNYINDEEGTEKQLKDTFNKVLNDLVAQNKYEVASAISRDFEYAIKHTYGYNENKYPEEIKELLNIKDAMNSEQRKYKIDNEVQKASSLLTDKGFTVNKEDWGPSVKLSQIPKLDKETLDTYLSDIGDFNIQKGQAILSISKNGDSYTVNYEGSNDFPLNTYDSFDDMKNILIDKEALKEEIANAKSGANARYSRY